MQWRDDSAVRNFNNIRNDRSESTPEVLKDVQEMRAIMEAEIPGSVRDACEDCMNDQFIMEATENGVARRENAAKITPFATDTLDDRDSGCSVGITRIFRLHQRSLEASLSEAGGYILAGYEYGDLYVEREGRSYC